MMTLYKITERGVLPKCYFSGDYGQLKPNLMIHEDMQSTAVHTLLKYHEARQERDWKCVEVLQYVIEIRRTGCYATCMEISRRSQGRVILYVSSEARGEYQVDHSESRMTVVPGVFYF